LSGLILMNPELKIKARDDSGIFIIKKAKLAAK
jgi:hypothetical protein